MDSHTLIQALIYLGAAALIVPIAVRLGLGSVLGYLIAGCIIGPWALRLVTDAEAILHFAEIGVVLMLFVIGLELDPQRLWKLRASVFGGGALQMVACGGVDRPVLHAAGPALAGGRADWYDSGAFLNRDRYAGDE
ncbi:glutathione-regulated potassium-efflux system protein KefC [Klebsiella pneumoniae]|uniref:Glutathione-regulated potassium-efflux system protein KefC n=1 Tax=Klebsiella pneumoniae TaxID=573 RepID=A0A4P0XUT3_KLEPN|nr:glutathione-regulated potassium-efflux system protein KefC [Klebsiella pneumoniae]